MRLKTVLPGLFGSVFVARPSRLVRVPDFAKATSGKPAFAPGGGGTDTLGVLAPPP